ncbi:MAG: 50S ribosomal protein L1 [Gammaproteobacteria bacterium]
MAKLTKRQKAFADKVSRDVVHSAEDALKLVKELASAKFSESVDVSVNLGIDPRKSDQVVRGSVVLPHGTGKEVRVAVFTQGENADKAKAAGADAVGMDDLAEAMKGGDLDYGTVIATPDAMRVVGQLGRVLGPRGLMPNPKVGTVTQDVEAAVKAAKGGQVRFRADKAGIVHCAIGKVDFDVKALQENMAALLADVVKSKPASAKGQYLKRMSVSSTMGPGIAVDSSTV